MKTNHGLSYCVSFDTKEMPGLVVGIRVQIDKQIIRKGDSVRVALCDHPLYPQLERYVLGNPSGNPKVSK